MSTLEVSCLGIRFENPFLLSSAPPTARIESIDTAFGMGWGGAVLKTITPDTLDMQEVSPRYASLKDGGHLLGFQNIELLSHKSVRYWADGIHFLKKKHPTKVIIASIMAPVIKEEWQNLVQTLNKTPIDAFELNFSCPHGMPEKGIGMAIGTDAEISAQITRWVKEVAEKPVFVKLSPNVTDIAAIACAVRKAGTDGLSAINTVQCLMGVDLDTLEPQPSVNGFSTYGGYSGKAVKPIGLRCVAQLRKESDLPILGIGGISDWKDAAEYISLGADAVQICTEVMINGYCIIDGLKKGLSAYLEEKGFENLSRLKNLAVSKMTTHESLNKTTHLFPIIDKEKCIRCGKCVMVCSESGQQALSKETQEISLLKEKCVGCSLCKHACPKQAVRMGC